MQMTGRVSGARLDQAADPRCGIGRFRRVSRRVTSAPSDVRARRHGHRQPEARARKPASPRFAPAPSAVAAATVLPSLLLPPCIRLGACAPSPDARSRFKCDPARHLARSNCADAVALRTNDRRNFSRFRSSQCALHGLRYTVCASIRCRPTSSPCARASPLAASPRIPIRSDARGPAVIWCRLPFRRSLRHPRQRAQRTTARGSMPAGDGRRCRRPLHLRA